MWRIEFFKLPHPWRLSHLGGYKRSGLRPHLSSILIRRVRNISLRQDRVPSIWQLCTGGAVRRWKEWWPRSTFNTFIVNVNQAGTTSGTSYAAGAKDGKRKLFLNSCSSGSKSWNQCTMEICWSRMMQHEGDINQFCIFTSLQIYGIRG